jgi:hypothetical protein
MRRKRPAPEALSQRRLPALPSPIEGDAFVVFTVIFVKKGALLNWLDDA